MKKLNRCKGINLDGSRCKRRITSEYCIAHNPMFGYEKTKTNKRKQRLTIKFDLNKKGSPITHSDVLKCRNKQEKFELLSNYYSWLNASRRDDKWAMKRYLGRISVIKRDSKKN